MSQIAYWIAHETSGWISTPTGAQIAAGKLSNDTTNATFSGSEIGFTTSGTVTIDEATAISIATSGTSYTQAWAVYDTDSATYSNPVIGTVTTDSGGGTTHNDDLTDTVTSSTAESTLLVIESTSSETVASAEASTNVADISSLLTETVSFLVTEDNNISILVDSTDSTTFSDSSAGSLDIAVDTSETNTSSEVNSSNFSVDSLVADSITSDETSSILLELNTDTTDTLTSSDSITNLAVFEVSSADSVTSIESSSISMVIVVDNSETISISESQQGELDNVSLVNETESILDSQNSVHVANKLIEETASPLDVTDITLVLESLNLENVTLSETNVSGINILLEAQETLVITDDITGDSSNAASIQETDILLDTSDTSVVFVSSNEESITTSEINGSVHISNVIQLETETAVDIQSNSAVLNSEVNETVSLLDSIVGAMTAAYNDTVEAIISFVDTIVNMIMPKSAGKTTFKAKARPNTSSDSKTSGVSNKAKSRTFTFIRKA